MSGGFISVRGAREHNLKNIDIDIPKEKLVVITGVSGSGKSSLAFDTIYAEGRRRYVESLSAYARQFLEIHSKPDFESIEGLSPAIAIDQRTTSRNPRSTTATATEIYDYLRLLFARVGVPYSPFTNLPIEKQSASQIIETISQFPNGAKFSIIAPVIRSQKGEHRKELLMLKKQGYMSVMIDGELHDLDVQPKIDKNKSHDISVVVDRIEINGELGNRIADSIEQALRLGNGVIYIDIASIAEGANHKNGDRIIFSEKFACPISGFSITEIEPRIFSFNSPHGACPACSGMGEEVFFNPKLIVSNESLSLADGAITPWSKEVLSQIAQFKLHTQILESLARHYEFEMNAPFSSLSEKVKNVIFYGSEDEVIEFESDDGFRKSIIRRPFEGVVNYLQEKLQKILKGRGATDEVYNYQTSRNCTACGGHRLKRESLCVKIADKHIGQICEMNVVEAMNWIRSIDNSLTPKQQQIALKLVSEIDKRLGFLVNVGLDYITLNRKANTLSGGESQRIRLASQIGAGLSGVLYVLDEPSIGLHQRDNERLLNTLRSLRDLGNSVLVVEHDVDTMLASDHLIDIGPGAGVHGGYLVSQGTPQEVAQDPNSITGRYISNKELIPIPTTRRKFDPKKCIKVVSASSNNLKNITVTIPLGNFVVFTGVSGSGKSSLVINTIYKAITRKLHGTKVIPGKHEYIEGLENIDKVIQIDQSPIGRTPRSNPATYTGAFTHIRDWFAGLPEARARGYTTGRFSFNVKGGRCESCEGDGVLKIEMHFLSDVHVACDECQGKRYNKETLEIKCQGHSIYDVLNMTVADAMEFFKSMPLIYEKLLALSEVGLGYMKIGQSATTLSGGEAQRIKLAKELSKKSTGRTIYILDEPTTGLHMHDIKHLLNVLHKLADSNNSILIIEHNLDVIKTADYVIDIGPEGGDKGGGVVAFGSPYDIAANKDSITGRFLIPYLGL
ncbi:UvrABC system protein A [Candidatus Cyrtobacter comes]|uniref:UvrABC system protein A n=1 Tax=Candidatus Cyrtobacter comes TaxID=675776 RepID=A0ABU5L6Y2_9RICK|nr:excinuclease ABC subunit UvrA [Candidatus Cyrtobacter comes]MDZ5761878.1 UvrABC system protein A [Candidatus Cyrtobacter comes]